jgi:hypothetical protein
MSQKPCGQAINQPCVTAVDTVTQAGDDETSALSLPLCVSWLAPDRGSGSITANNARPIQIVLNESLVRPMASLGWDKRNGRRTAQAIPLIRLRQGYPLISNENNK